MFFDSFFNAKPVERDATAQEQVNQQAQKLALYHYDRCPFCVRVRRAIHRLNVPIELRDILRNDADREALLMGGGRTTVPCLRIEGDNGVTWLYESSDIIAYLERKFMD